MIATNNSFSYLTPHRWWMRLFTPFKRCQVKNIEEQLNAGTRCFDLRLQWYNNQWYVGNGIVTYLPFTDCIYTLNRVRGNTPIYVRLTFEGDAPLKAKEDLQPIIDLFDVRRLRFVYGDFTPIVVLHKLHHKYMQPCVATAQSRLGGLMPCLWSSLACRNRDKWMQFANNTKSVVAFDFL